MRLGEIILGILVVLAGALPLIAQYNFVPGLELIPEITYPAATILLGIILITIGSKYY